MAGGYEMIVIKTCGRKNSYHGETVKNKFNRKICRKIICEDPCDNEMFRWGSGFLIEC